MVTFLTEVEYVTLLEASKDVDGFAKDCFTSFEDNQSCVKLTNMLKHNRVRHIDVKYLLCTKSAKNRLVIDQK